MVGFVNQVGFIGPLKAGLAPTVPVVRTLSTVQHVSRFTRVPQFQSVMGVGFWLVIE